MGEMHRGVGSTAKSAVDRSHVAAINRVMTPSTDEVQEAYAIIEAFEAARATGKDRARRGDLLIEVPSYLSAKRLVVRAAEPGVKAG